MRPDCFASFLDNSLRVFFDNDQVSEIAVSPDGLPTNHPWFSDWPYRLTWDISFIEAYLLRHHIPYFHLERDGWIATSTGFYATPIKGGEVDLNHVGDSQRFPSWISSPVRKYGGFRR